MIPIKNIVEVAGNRSRPSPNRSARPGANISLIILHATADNGNELGAEEWLTHSKAQASAHLHIRRDGSITRMVPDKERAWHAGASTWTGVTNVNSESIGWEIANKNDGKEPYSTAQYTAVVKLLRHYLPQGIERKNVLSHAQVAPGRKSDPLGWRWDRMWREYDELAAKEEAASAIGHHALFGIPTSPPEPVLQAALKRLADRIKCLNPKD